MFNLSKRADYALLALSHLAATRGADPERLVNTKEIAEQYEIPLELLAKIMQTLAKSGLVASLPGPTGGYRLRRAPSEVSVAEIVAAIDGPLAILPCSNGLPGSCKQFSHCIIRDPMHEIETRISRLLQTITLAEISGADKAEPGLTAFRDFSSRPFAAGLPVG